MKNTLKLSYESSNKKLIQWELFVLICLTTKTVHNTTFMTASVFDCARKFRTREIRRVKFPRRKYRLNETSPKGNFVVRKFILK